MNSEAFDKILEPITTYRSKTRLFDLYSIAESISQKNVEAIFNLTFARAQSDYIELTELVMVLNYKLHGWYGLNPKSPYVSTYDKLYRQASEWAEEHLKGEELHYYFLVTD